MRNKKTSKIKGISLLEILISMILFALVMEGFFALLTSTKRHIKRSDSKMVQAELGRYFLDPLQEQVRQDQIATNCLYTDSCAAEENPQIVGPVTYTPDYETSQVGTTSLRRAKITIQYPIEAYE